MAPPQTVQVLTCVPPRLGTRLRSLQAQRRLPVHVFVQATQIPDVNDVEHVLGADSLIPPPVVPVTAIFLRGKGYHLRHTTPNRIATVVSRTPSTASCAPQTHLFEYCDVSYPHKLPEHY